MAAINEKISTHNPTTTDNWTTTVKWTTSDGNTTEDTTSPSPDDGLSPAAIAGISVAAMVIVILILVAVCYRKKLASLCSTKSPSPPPYMQEPPFQATAYDETKAGAEFEDLDAYRADKSQTEGNKQDNISKNRYQDIIPYDFNRVKLGEGGYINASLIEPFFIATQDPLLGETEAVWLMVWENKVVTIVRLSEENNRAAMDQSHKQSPCPVYIPDVGGTWVIGSADGNISVNPTASSNDEAYVKTDITLKQDEYCRKVTHYHIQDWKSSKYPSPASTWKTINKMMETPHNADRRVLVHCGAGAGRTGTFIALWRLYESHRAGKTASILDICKQLRNQRPGMVTKKDQYDYIYQCAKELEDFPLATHKH